MPGSAARPGGARRSLRTLALALPAVLLVLAAATVPAGASVIVYRCAPNLCEVNPDGSGRHALTGDGDAGAYGSPSLSRDGTHLAFVRGSGELFTADAGAGARVGPISHSALLAYMSPDGTRVADLENFGLGEPVALCGFAVDGSGRDCPASAPSAGWAPGDGLLISTYETSAEPQYTAICLLGPGGSGCERYVAHDPDRRLYDPAVSPDGSTLALTAVPVSAGDAATRGSIALFDYASGAFRGDLTVGPEDGEPAWSPDGTQIAFARGGSIYTIAAAGPPGSERLLVAGDSPTWGEGSAGPSPVPSPAPSPAPGAATASPALRLGKPKLDRRRGTATLAVTVPGAGTVRLSGKAVKSARRRARKAGGVTLPVRPKGKARRRLLRAGRAAVEVKIAFVPAAGGATLHATRRLRLALGPARRR
jgi:hypothetical protein